ncbi:hypothetical protein SAY87_023428 [Trapa incisa]|uniref:NAC domain-containing protein n=1 Tax=Trapa incisa TaxID=236973 RepID=A0AAN7KXR3_9MYRT|nr:hypothetical protein SAY87_023428 [Trapa incisa]
MGDMADDFHLPPGFRFFPTDEELITHYLICKSSDENFTTRAIGVVDLNKFEPWDLPGEASMGEKEWYFFSLRGRKYPTGVRTNRATRAGYWKTTGKDKEIYRADHQRLIGKKKTLVFYEGRAPRGVKTDWVMHEYRLEKNRRSHESAKEEWVVCRVSKKTSAAEKSQRSTSSVGLANETADTMANFQPKDTEMAGPYTALDSSVGFSSRSDIGTLSTMKMNCFDTIPSYGPEALNRNDLPVDYSALLFKALEHRTKQARDELLAILGNSNLAGSISPLFFL